MIISIREQPMSAHKDFSLIGDEACSLLMLPDLYS
jgi:hypothetical protein